MLDVNKAIEAFFQQVAGGAVDIYNECSLQHELGIFLRSVLGAGTHKVQFERPVGFFGFSRSGFVKNEIDLSVFASDRSERVAIEVKFPRSGQYPEQMFKFCQDVVFVEQLVAAGFNAGYFVVVADDPLFFSGSQTGIYSHFRGRVPLQGTIVKPTGQRDESVTICGSYTVEWRDAGSVRYACVGVSPGVRSNEPLRATRGADALG